MVGELLVKASHVILQARTHGHVVSAPPKDAVVAKCWVRHHPAVRLLTMGCACLAFGAHACACNLSPSHKSCIDLIAFAAENP